MTDQKSTPQELDLAEMVRGRASSSRSVDPFADLADLVSDLRDEIERVPGRRDAKAPAFDDFGDVAQPTAVLAEEPVSVDPVPAEEPESGEPVYSSLAFRQSRETPAVRSMFDDGFEQEVLAGLTGGDMPPPAADDDLFDDSDFEDAFRAEVAVAPAAPASAADLVEQDIALALDDEFSDLELDVLDVGPEEQFAAPEFATDADMQVSEAARDDLAFDNGFALGDIADIDLADADFAAPDGGQFANPEEAAVASRGDIGQPDDDVHARDMRSQDSGSTQAMVAGAAVAAAGLALGTNTSPPAAVAGQSGLRQAEPEVDFGAAVHPYADAIEATGDLNVPEIAPVPEELPVAPGLSDEDFDFDADYAELSQQERQPAPETGFVDSDEGTDGARALEAEFEALFEDRLSSEFVSEDLGQPQAATGDARAGDPEFDDAFETDFDGALEEELARATGDLSDEAAPVVARPGMARGIMVAGIVAAVALGGVALLVGRTFLGEGTQANDGQPAVVRADNEPVKVQPDDPGGQVVPNQDRAVFDAVSGNSLDQPKQEVLVDARETPAIPAAKEEDRITSGGDASIQPQDDVLVLAPRRVQTVTVRPDGTLVENPAPAVNEPASSDVAVPEPRPEPVAEAVEPVSVPAPVEEAPAVAETAAQQVPAREVQAQRITPRNPVVPAEAIPVPSRPADQPVNIVNGAQVAAAQPPATVQDAFPAAPQAAGGVASGSYVVQIASQPSEAAAQSSYSSLSSRFSSIIGGRAYQIRAAEIPGKGTFYRVQIGAGSRDEANALCSRYKAAGGSCFVTR